MTIPSDPLQFPPDHRPEPLSPPENQPQSLQTSSSMDPAGIWAKFLSTPGNPATPKEVKLFITGLLNMFNILIRQETERAEKDAQKMKREIEGED